MSTKLFIEKYEAYARAIGLVILQMNSLEANIYFILDVMGEATPEDEGKNLRDKLKMLKRVAAKQTNLKTKARLEKIVRNSEGFFEDRNNFAHANLWVDAETNVFRRRYVRQKDNHLVDDDREPVEIEAVNDAIRLVSWDARDVAMDLGGNKRWDEYLDSLGPDAVFIKPQKPPEPSAS